MNEKKGTISIHAQNIMPIIKKWLYSDKDIFVRELVSNGCDAIAKFKLLVSRGEATAAPDENYAVYQCCRLSSVCPRSAPSHLLCHSR